MDSNGTNEISVGGLDRGDKTLEQLESEMNPAALALVQGMTDNIVNKDKRKTRHFYRRNRRAVDRMNRPHRLAAVEKGAEKMLNLINLGKPVTDAELEARVKTV